MNLSPECARANAHRKTGIYSSGYGAKNPRRTRDFDKTLSSPIFHPNFSCTGANNILYLYVYVHTHARGWAHYRMVTMKKYAITSVIKYRTMTQCAITNVGTQLFWFVWRAYSWRHLKMALYRLPLVFFRSTIKFKHKKVYYQ